VVLILGIAGTWFFRKKVFFAHSPRWHWAAQRRRFARGLPLAFLVLASLATLGGLLHAPTNYDALAYRTPRVLHWLSEGRWHWIHTEFQRLNTRGSGFEWMSAPILALARTDRLLFALNVISWLLLPGLVFSLFTRLGVRPRVAWNWMWILPLGYCFLLQAGSIGNDLFPVPLMLAALDFALRASRSRRVGELWLSVLAVGLVTGIKANNLPLLLVWVVVAVFCGPVWKTRRLATLTVLAVALLASFLPTAILNSMHTGDWRGEKAEHLQLRASNPAIRLAGNLAIFCVHNFTPTIAPFAGNWNEHVIGKLPQNVKAALDKNFMGGAHALDMAELQVEEGAGLGFGVCSLLALATIGAILAAKRDRNLRPRRVSVVQGLVYIAAGIAFAAFAEASSVGSGARLLSGYYPLMVAPFLMLAGHSRVVRKRWWKAAVIATAALAVVPVALNPARPLIPMRSVLKILREKGWSGPLLDRVERVYSIYGGRADAFAPAVRLLPPETEVVGLVTLDDPETGLWRPFGARRVVHVCLGDSAAKLRTEKIRFVWVNSQKFAGLFSVSFEDWLTQLDAEMVQTVTLNLRAGEGPVQWRLVRLR
jgi:hypothetical protein